MKINRVRLGDVAVFVNDKQALSEASINTYVSTENLQPDKKGIIFPASSLPTVGKVNTYVVGDILVSNIRPYFKKIWHANLKGTHSADVLNIRSSSECLLQSYLAVVLSDNQFFDYMMATSKGTKMPRGDKDAIMNYEFRLPSTSDQQLIANCISTIDQKIENDQQINQNLLKLAGAIVAHQIKQEKTRFQTVSSLQEYLTVSDHIANGSFKAIKSNVVITKDSGYALFLRNIDLKQDLMISDKRWVSKSSYDFLKKSRLFGGEVIISNVGDVGSVHRVPKTGTPMVAGNNIIFLQSSDQWLTDYLYIYFLSRYGQHQIDSITSGSAQQKFNKTDFRDLKIPLLKKRVVEAVITPLLSLLDTNKQEIASLTALRDLLLPKLLSGEIELSNITEVIEDA